MRLLLDTHAFMWWLAGNRRLSPAARRAVDDSSNDVVVSAATAWEITTKHRVGKLPEAEAVARDVTASIASQGFEELEITVKDAERAGRLPGAHRDPFDRMLIAQALTHNLTVVSIDSVFDRYGVSRLW
ncbi:MAG: type II toxin-antitoxin system VapC family toxin [Deltaproteobacteria bacterium]|nr:type II toxin-antitoxin system VapC family toxin [Deltaproteobacteria bacterium]